MGEEPKLLTMAFSAKKNYISGITNEKHRTHRKTIFIKSKNDTHRA
jgi:hypothetical protein